MRAEEGISCPPVVIKEKINYSYSIGTLYTHQKPNHFPCGQWHTNNIKSWYLVTVTLIVLHFSVPVQEWPDCSAYLNGMPQSFRYSSMPCEITSLLWNVVVSRESPVPPLERAHRHTTNLHQDERDKATVEDFNSKHKIVYKYEVLGGLHTFLKVSASTGNSRQ